MAGLFTRRAVLTILLVAFILLRIFTSNPSLLLHADSLKFMEAAKHFPKHTLYNNQMYLLHPPLYPYLIYFFTLIFQQDHIAAVFISLISSVIAFFVIYRLFMMLTRSFKTTFFVLFFYTLSDSMILFSRLAMRESLIVMLVISSLYFYANGIKNRNFKSIACSTATSSILAITSDHVLLLIPAFGLSYLILNKEKVEISRFKFPALSYAVLPVIFILLFYGSWSVIKYIQYSMYDYYPNGHSGIPLSTKNVGILQTISSRFFEEFKGEYIKPGMLSYAKRFVFNIGYMFNMQPFPVPRGLNFTTMKFLLKPMHIAYMLLIYVPLSLIFIYGIFSPLAKITKTRKIKIHNNTNLYILCLFIIFISLLTQDFASPRHILPAYIFFFYFLSCGLVSLLDKLPSVRSAAIPIFLIILMAVVPFWLVSNNNFIFLSKKALTAQNTGDFINSNIPKDAGIMAQPGYTANLDYHIDNRVIGLHPVPSMLDDIIDIFDIGYVVVGRYYTYDFYQLSRDSVEYIRNNPDKFELVAAIKEDYSDFYGVEYPLRTDDVWVYGVKSNNLNNKD